MSPEKRIKALRKKLTQIEKLKSRGGAYSEEEAQKIAAEASMEAEIGALERGEPWPPVGAPAAEPAAAVAPAAVAEPAKQEVVPEVKSPAQELVVAEPAKEEVPEVPSKEVSPEEAQRRTKALKKKLAQIAKLKERVGVYNAEEKEKIASEKKMLAEVAALEAIV